MLLLGLGLMGVTSCGDDDGEMPIPAEPGETGMSMSYDLGAVNNSGVNGTVRFAALDNNEVKITISLSGTTAGASHPAHLHDNTAAEGGGIAISLEPVDGATGMSETIISAKDDGTPITYDELLDFDGYVNVHLSMEDLATIVAQGDIGQNDLTGMSTAYDLGEVAVPGINGSVTFFERVNSQTLAIIELANTPDGGSHPAHIHVNTAAEGGGIAVSFTSVDGTSGMSKTNIAMLDDGTPITYDELLEFDGYVNVHLSMEDLATIVAQGDIGQNDLTGMSTAYDLTDVDIAGVSGTATFEERINGETLVTIVLTGTSFAGDHPSHIHAGSVAEAPGGILITLTSVDNQGVSKTNVISNDAGDSLTYGDLVMIDGYINVHNSASDLGTLVAQGDVGANGQ